MNRRTKNKKRKSCKGGDKEGKKTSLKKRKKEE